MKDINKLGIDLAKNIFQVYAEDAMGNELFNRKYTRSKFKQFMDKLPPCQVAMEACGTAHYWGREFESRNHQVKLINPRAVKPYVTRNKTDLKDAEAICEASKSKRINPIPVKTIPQQDLTALHKARKLFTTRRVQLTNHLRSLLAEYGIIAAKGYAPLKTAVINVLAGECGDFSADTLFVINDIKQSWEDVSSRIKEYDLLIRKAAKHNKMAMKFMQIPGIAEITSTAIVAKVDDFSSFRKGRDFAAWLGLTPKEYSSAGNRRLGGISKQGDRYIRYLLVHGARAAIQATLSKNKFDTAYDRWIQQLVARVGKNKAAVAVANKNARTVWALATHDRSMDLNFSESFA